MPPPGVTVLKVSDLRKLARLASEAMRAEVGPMALVQRPAEQLLQRAAMKQAVAVTVPVGRPKVASHALSLLLDFADMLVIPLGAVAAEGTLTLGRAPECDVQVADPSTSSRHALVRWDAWKRAAWIADLGSTNGTFVNGVRLTGGEAALAEGDTLSLGDAAFFFVHVETLHALLRAAPG